MNNAETEAATRMTCHAPHPRIAVRGAQVLCSSFIGWHTGSLEFVGIAWRAPTSPNGEEWARCPNAHCHAWNRWRIVSEKVA